MKGAAVSIAVLCTVSCLSAGRPAGAAAPPPACNDMWASWSPDGKSIVFGSDRSGDPEIYVLRLGDPSARRLTVAPGRDAHPAYSPDGSRIGFQSPRQDGHTNLYVMNTDGSGQQRLTSHQGFAGVPAWSPDGRRLAYQWRPDQENARWRLMMLRIGSSAEPEQLTDGSSNDQVPNWSPDGTRLLFYSDRTGKDQLYTWSAGVVARQLTSSHHDKTGTWSPDGRRIAFLSDRAGGPAAVYVMSSDGGDLRRVGTVTPEHGAPFFSPDGNTLLIQPPGPAGTEVRRMYISTGETELLSRCVAPHSQRRRRLSSSGP